jgi:hypothetical protein
MSLVIPPKAFHYATGTWSDDPGQTAGTTCKHLAASAGQTSIVTIPIMLPQNSVALKGSYLKSVEVNYEITDAALTSITASAKVVGRGIEGAVATPVTLAVTQDLVAAVAAATVAIHKLTVTITVPQWIKNTEYVLLVLTCVQPAVNETDFHNAIANFELRV